AVWAWAGALAGGSDCRVGPGGATRSPRLEGRPGPLWTGVKDWDCPPKPPNWANAASGSAKSSSKSANSDKPAKSGLMQRPAQVPHVVIAFGFPRKSRRKQAMPRVCHSGERVLGANDLTCHARKPDDGRLRTSQNAPLAQAGRTDRPGPLAGGDR